MKKFLIVFLASLIFLNCGRLFPISGEGDGDSEPVDVGVEGDWAQDVFGDVLELNIMKPLNFWNMEGTASIWSIIAFLYSFISIILFLGFLFAIGIGTIKWVSSQGQEPKVQSAQKWMKNAVMGFAAVIIVFIIISFISIFFGIGSVFEMGQNLAVCGEGASAQVMYEFKNQNPSPGEGYVSRCNGGWHWEYEGEAGLHPGI